MARLVLDIESLAFPFESFDEAQQQYLLRFATNDQERAELLQRLNLYPTTARVIAVGMLNPDTDRAKILFHSTEPVNRFSADNAAHFVSGTEHELLTEFWADVAKYDQIITFNGRAFDCPFLLLRSAMLGIKPSRNLLPYRYDPAIHCDLLEQFTFYGALRKFNLDFYCKAFGIESPKSHGITGHDLGRLFEEQRFLQIAEYCLDDLRATAELFRRWEMYLNFPR